jgi:hypothetical protein
MATVKVVGYAERANKLTGLTFIALILAGAIQAVKSATGTLRLETPKASIPTNLTKEQAEHLVASEQELDGEIENIQVAKYQFTGTDGVVRESDRRWQFKPGASMKTRTAQPVAQVVASPEKV